MRYITLVKIPWMALALLQAISACTVLGGASSEPTSTPMPTSIIKGLQVVEPQACLVAEQGVIRVEQQQGDLVAWSPVENRLAYVASTQASSWNVGDLYLLSVPDFQRPVRLATQAAGELAWSPEGNNLAYLSLRRRDNLYTIALVNPNGRGSKDLFADEAARTDNYASQKAIVRWLDEGRLRVLTSCGVDCMQAMDFGILSGLSRSFGNPFQRSWDLWSVVTHQPRSIPPEFSNLTGQLNWSPDEKRIAYIDEDGNLWLVDIDSSSLYQLDGEEFGTAFETDWSFDSQYLAVRIDKDLRLYAFDCP